MNTIEYNGMVFRDYQARDFYAGPDDLFLELSGDDWWCAFYYSRESGMKAWANTPEVAIESLAISMSLMADRLKETAARIQH